MAEPLSSFIRITSVDLKDPNQTQFNAEAFSAKFTCVEPLLILALLLTV